MRHFFANIRQFLRCEHKRVYVCAVSQLFDALCTPAIVEAVRFKQPRVVCVIRSFVDGMFVLMFIGG